jgi:hypothetical protein
MWHPCLAGRQPSAKAPLEEVTAHILMYRHEPPELNRKVKKIWKMLSVTCFLRIFIEFVILSTDFTKIFIFHAFWHM